MSGRIVIGTQCVREALRAHGGKVEEVLLQAQRPKLEGLQRLAESVGVRVNLVSERELDALCKAGMHQGAIARAPDLRLHGRPSLEQSNLVLALDGVQDPQNFGAAIRSAVGVAGAAVLWSENSSAPLTQATFRASAGAIEHARLCRVPSLTQALQEAVEEGFQVVALDAHAPTPLFDTDLRPSTILVVGGEGRGLSRAVRRYSTTLARLVLPSTIDSLNASVAAALALYEAVRQRHGSTS